MVARLGKAPWFESFDVDAEVAELLAHIERCTGFALPEHKREVRGGREISDQLLSCSD